MKYKQITFEIIDQVARIGFGKYTEKPLTTLELETMDELEAALLEIAKKQQTDVKGLVFFSHKKNVFLAGMNVQVISDLRSVDDGVKGASPTLGMVSSANCPASKSNGLPSSMNVVIFGVSGIISLILTGIG